MALVTTLVALLTVLGTAQSLTVRVKSTSPRVITRGNDAQDDFMRKVYEEQVKRATRASVPNLPNDQLETVEGGHKMRKDAAAQCKLLLKEANSDLKRQKQEGNREALKVSDVSVYSAYRSVEHDTEAWRNAFKKHLRATKENRAKLNGGEYGDEAVDLMVKRMRKFKAAPGFSRHTSGVAVDFKTTEDDVTLTANSNQNERWKRTWFHKWLVKNAGRFKFKPLATEAWHWEYAK
jgi:LAS superfamily LD-carboxypeptidase LdcB